MSGQNDPRNFFLSLWRCVVRQLSSSIENIGNKVSPL